MQIQHQQQPQQVMLIQQQAQQQQYHSQQDPRFVYAQNSMPLSPQGFQQPMHNQLYQPLHNQFQQPMESAHQKPMQNPLVQQMQNPQQQNMYNQQLQVQQSPLKHPMNNSYQQMQQHPLQNNQVFCGYENMNPVMQQPSIYPSQAVQIMPYQQFAQPKQAYQNYQELTPAKVPQVAQIQTEAHNDLPRQISFGIDRSTLQRVSSNNFPQNQSAVFDSSQSLRNSNLSAPQPSLYQQNFQGMQFQSNIFQEPHLFQKLIDFQRQQETIQVSQGCKVSFQVTCKTQINECVALVGSSLELGGWQITKAVSLATSDQLYPQWSVEIDLPKNTAIEYKYVKVKHETNKQNVVWEVLSANRVLNTHGRAIIFLQEEFSSAKTQQEYFKEDPLIIGAEQKNSFTYQMVSPVQQLSNQNSIHIQTPLTLLNESGQKSPKEIEFKVSTFPQNLEKRNIISKENTPQKIANEPIQKIKKQKSFSEIDVELLEDQTNDLRIAQRDFIVNKLDDSELNIDSQEFMKMQLQEAFKDYNYAADTKNDTQTVGISGDNNSDSFEQKVHKTDNKSSHLNSNQDSNENGVRNVQPFGWNATQQPSVNQAFSSLKPFESTQIDSKEPIIVCTFYLPYRIMINPKKPSEFIAHQCYHNPTFLYGLLDQMAQQKTYNFIWIGIVSTPHRLTEYEERLANEALLKKNCYAIYLTAEELEPFMKFYEGLLRPRMHNFFDPFDAAQQDNALWPKYTEVSMKVAEKVNEVRLLHPQLTMVWVNGDHLMMCPNYIRSKFEKANIGFYFHSSFPASSIFQTFYKRNEILQSLLCSDIVGFHLFEFARNFMNCCHRLFGLQYQFGAGGSLAVYWHGRAILVSVKHIGIDEGFIRHMRSSSIYRNHEKKFKEEFKQITKLANKSNSDKSLALIANSRSHAFFNNVQTYTDEENPSRSVSTSNSSEDLQNVNGEAIINTQSSRRTRTSQERPGIEKPIIISSIDSFHPMAGIKQKLKAYQTFLREYDDYRNKIVLIQFVPSILCLSENLPSQGHPGEETKETTVEKKHQIQQQIVEQIPIMNELQADIKAVIKEITQEFGQHSLIMMDGNPTLEKRLAIWSQTQILLVSTLKDGLCLPPLEFATVKSLQGDFENSGMILSEYCGSSNAFSGFHSFNPFDQQEFCKALDTCLNMTGEKKSQMMRQAYKYCQYTTFSAWVENFLKELKKSYTPYQYAETRYIFTGLTTVDCMQAQQSLSLSQNTKMPQQLNIISLNQDFQQSTRCLIIINHEVLPCKLYGQQQVLQPQDQIIEYLSDMSQDSRNIVCVFSSEERSKVQKAFEKLPNVWLAAENGYWYKTDKSGWKRLFQQYSTTWLRILRKIFDQYCENIEGTVVDERESTISWNYKNAAQEHGLKFAKELYKQVKGLIGNNAPVKVVQGNGFIEVLPTQLKKEKLMKLILNHVATRADRKIDFLLFIGSDLRDEKSFEYLKAQTAQNSDHSPKYFDNDIKTKLCIIGKRPSNADFYLDSETQVAHLIQKLGQSTQIRKKTRSYSNLISFHKRMTSDSLTGENEKTHKKDSPNNKEKEKNSNQIATTQFDGDNLQLIVEELPEDEEQSCMMISIEKKKDGAGLTSPTYSNIDGQLSMFPKIERHESHGQLRHFQQMGRHESQNDFESKERIQFEENKIIKSIRPCNSHHEEMLAEPMRRKNNDLNEKDSQSFKPKKRKTDKHDLTVDDIEDVEISGFVNVKQKGLSQTHLRKSTTSPIKQRNQE